MRQHSTSVQQTPAAVLPSAVSRYEHRPALFRDHLPQPSDRHVIRYSHPVNPRKIIRFIHPIAHHGPLVVARNSPQLFLINLEPTTVPVTYLFWTSSCRRIDRRSRT